MSSERTHQIALVRYTNHELEGYSAYDSGTSVMIAQSITEWSTVTSTQLELLRKAQTYDHHMHRFVIIEREFNEQTHIENTISAYLDWAGKQEAKRIKEEAERKAQAESRKLKRLAKDEAAKRRLLDQLKKELGE